MTRSVTDVVRGRTEAMLTLLAELVEVNSYSQNKAGGDRVAEILEREARAIGLETSRTASERYADHLIWSTPAGARSIEGGVVLVGHHDTVFAPGTFEGFRRDGDLVRGPGVLDMKGGLVVMLEALRALRELGAEVPVRVLCVGDEEVGSPEGKGVIQAEAQGAAAALVFEAGRAHDRVITSRKGVGAAKVTARGKAAHAANDHASGVNAIWAMARFVDRAQAITDYARGITVNVGIIRGGDAKNTVPPEASCEIDFRFERMVDADATFERLCEAAREAQATLPGATIEVSGSAHRLPLERTVENVALYEAYATCAREAGLGGDEAPLVAGGSDASTTSAIGIPSIDGLGPRGAGFHTSEERVEIASLEPKVVALTSYLLASRR